MQLTSLPEPTTYLSCYIPNENWLDTVPNPLEILQSYFPQFFEGNQVEWGRMEILKNSSKLTKYNPNYSHYHKATELFKALYKLPMICAPDKLAELDRHPALRSIISLVGNRIIAHGVEEAKGGMYNLLLMCVSQTVFAGANQWGQFLDGPPNISPLCHGPYYIIYSTNGIEHPNNPGMAKIECILVPFKENIDTLKTILQKMLENSLITRIQKSDFERKLTYYDELAIKLIMPSAQQPSKRTIPDTFDNPPSKRLHVR